MPLALQASHTYFRNMKRILTLSLLSIIAGTSILQAQDFTPLPNSTSPASTAASVATRQEAEENYNALRSQIEELQTAQTDQRKKIQELLREVEDLKQQLSKPKQDAASPEDVRQLAATVQEIDKKRQADKELILGEIKRLGRAVTDTPPVRGKRTSNSSTASTASSGGGESGAGSSAIPSGDSNPSANKPGFYYTVKPGNSFSLIVQGYRDQGIKVTRQQVLDANPKLNPQKLLVGTRIFIPDPSKK